MIHRRLEQLRILKGVTHADVAKYLGITRQAYANYEKDREIKTDALVKLTQYFNTSADYLLGLTDDPRPSGMNSGIEMSCMSVKIKMHMKDIGAAGKDIFEDEAWLDLSYEEVEMINLHFKLIADLSKKRQQYNS
ncbi:hypothetical protein bcgnr5372_26310 [Bacillus luti]|nr:helix-turn-helix transcriptional regulator [Bacillus cereus]HDR8329422.1 helix-turn-helix transcriptional regulator [Bacillus cereus]HDR8335974.1 helix-turn-helix transcriptional regulator [Bacillus cereus]